jgi:dCTP diphosphatase
MGDAAPPPGAAAAAAASDAPPPGAPGAPWAPVPLERLRAATAAFAAARDWEQFHAPRNLLLALVGEVGELSELFMWRGDMGAGPGLPGWAPAEKAALGEELADVLLYLVRLADRCGVDLGAAAAAKLEKNGLKYPAARCRGLSAKYMAYADGGGGAGGGAEGGAEGGSGAE